MKHTHDMKKRIEEMLNSLDGVQRAQPQPYFYTRLKARMARDQKGWGGIAGIISRPVYALAMICVVLLMNTWIVFRETGDTKVVNSLQATTEQLPDEYNVAVNSFYDYETPSYE
jgi:hypothetical protein